MRGSAQEHLRGHRLPQSWAMTTGAVSCPVGPVFPTLWFSFRLLGMAVCHYHCQLPPVNAQRSSAIKHNLLAAILPSMIAANPAQWAAGLHSYPCPACRAAGIPRLTEPIDVEGQLKSGIG
jgi:hypothetical protein